MKKIKVLVADDHTIVRKGLCALLEEEKNIEVIGEAGDGREAVRKAGSLNPDIILLDIRMPILNGIEAARQISQNYPDIKVLVLTMYSDDEHVFELLNAGAGGYILKKSAPSELVNAINALSQGDAFLSPLISKKVLERLKERSINKNRAEVCLTNREREVVQLIAEGCTNKQIGERLCISIKTVVNHRSRLMMKLDIHNTAGLTHYAIRKGIIDTE